MIRTNIHANLMESDKCSNESFKGFCIAIGVFRVAYNPSLKSNSSKILGEKLLINSNSAGVVSR